MHHMYLYMCEIHINTNTYINYFKLKFNAVEVLKKRLYLSPY